MLVLASILALGSAAALADGGSAARDAMANAMAKMMEAMGFLDSNKGSPIPESMPFNPGGFGMPGMTPGFGMGAMPWSTPAWSNPAQVFGMDQMMQQMPGAMQQMPGAGIVPDMPGWNATTVDGIWEGRDGGLLIVRGPRFRLYSPNSRHVDGLIQQRGDRIALYNPEDQVARPYEYAELQGRLILRDADGQVFLYRRLWLDDKLPQGLSGGSGGSER